MDSDGPGGVFKARNIGNVEDRRENENQNSLKKDMRQIVVNLLHCTFLLMQLMGAPVTFVNSIFNCFHVSVAEYCAKYR